MESFRESLLKRRAMFRMLCIVLAVVILIIELVLRSNLYKVTDFANGCLIGILIGCEIILFMNSNKISKGLKNEENLKLLYINENDERNKIIKLKVTSTLFYIVLALLMVSTSIALIYNQTIAFTLFAVIIMIVVIRLLLEIYFKNKY